MKKTIATLAALATIGLSQGALALKVGDKMPAVKGNIVRRIPVSNYDAMMNLYANEQGKPEQTRVYKICGGEEEANPYAVYLFDEKTVYQDTDRDGYIDRKDQGDAIKRPSDDMPECK